MKKYYASVSINCGRIRKMDFFSRRSIARYCENLWADERIHRLIVVGTNGEIYCDCVRTKTDQHAEALEEAL